MTAGGMSASLAELTQDDVLGRPLCVALDGGLLRADPLWESALQLIRRRPWLLLLFPVWLLGGRARLRRILEGRRSLDAATLPYRPELLEHLRTCRAKGRRIVLWAGLEADLGQAVAQHLGLFDAVLASGEGGPEARQDNRGRLQAHFGPGGFDYLGNGDTLLPVLEAASRGYLVDASPAVARRVRSLGDKAAVLSRRPARWRALIKAVRPHQWAKNALVLVPVLVAPGLPSLRQILLGVVAAISFSLCASAGYVLNDLVDVDADRAHRSKRRRPFASGALPVVYGPPLFLGLIAVSVGLALLALPLGFLGMLAVYFVATLAYSFRWKSMLMVDVVVLAWLYTHRVLAGGIATSTHISAWLLAFSMFIFLSLAFAKRYVELRQSMDKGGKLHSRGYHTGDLEMVASMGPAAGYLAALVFCLYVEGDAGALNYRTPVLLWFICPVLLYWISRIWFLAHRGQLEDDPVKFALTDRASLACAALIAGVAAAARFWP